MGNEITLLVMGVLGLALTVSGAGLVMAIVRSVGRSSPDTETPLV